MNPDAAVKIADSKYPGNLSIEPYVSWGNKVGWVVINMINETISETPEELLDNNFRGTTAKWSYNG